MTQPNQDEALISAIAAQQNLDIETVRAVMEAQRDPTLVGPPAKTVQRDPVTGDVAVRVVRNGQPMWWVITQQDGSVTQDFNPNKEWPALFDVTNEGGA